MSNERDNLVVSAPPHIRSKDSSAKIMWNVIFSLVPSGIAGIFIFGLEALKVIILCIFFAVLTEAIFLKLRHRNLNILLDGSAVLTGLLLGYCLPSNVPFWIPVVGSFVGIALGKQLFGGLGQNIFNPALVGRAFLQISWPVFMTTWTNPRWMKVEAISSATPLLDAISSATPLALKKIESHYPFIYSKLPNYWNLFLGNHKGCIGEVCIFALLLGALFLLFKKIISWHTPFSFIWTLGILSWIFSGRIPFSGDTLFYILSGGLILGAFFMATDYVTSPLTNKGKLIFGFGCGLLTFIIRLRGSYPEGVCYAILFMDAAVPIIDRFTKTRKLGFVKTPFNLRG